MSAATAGPLLCLICLLLTMGLSLRDIPRFGTNYVITVCAAWASAYVIAGAKALIAPLADPALVGLGGSAAYLLVILFSGGRPATLLAPYYPESRPKIRGREAQVLYWKGWVLAIAIALGVIAYLVVTDPL